MRAIEEDNNHSKYIEIIDFIERNEKSKDVYILAATVTELIPDALKILSYWKKVGYNDFINFTLHYYDIATARN